MANSTADTCSTCPTQAGFDGHPLYPVIDENGRTERCFACLLTLVARVRTSEDLTVFLANAARVTR